MAKEKKQFPKICANPDCVIDFIANYKEAIFCSRLCARKYGKTHIDTQYGKDTVCDILREEFGYSFRSSSDFCAEKFIYAELKNKYGYTSYAQCFEDRHNHRAEWYDMIHAYCKNDYARLGREIFAENSIYCGLRNKSEFHAMRNTQVFDYAVWVDRSDHLLA